MLRMVLEQLLAMGWVGWVVVGVIGILAAGYYFIVWKEQRKCRRLKQSGVPVIAAVVQVDDSVYDPEGKWPAPPGQFIITFDPAVKEPRVFLPVLALKMMNLKGKEPADPDVQFVAKLVTDERYYHNRRVKLPTVFTGGPEVFVVYLSVHRGCLPGRHLQEPWVDCTATPGEQGEIEMTGTL